MNEKKSKFRRPGFSTEDISSSSSCSTSSFSSDDDDDDEDNTKPLKAIKDYLNNRSELAHQLFQSVKLEKIKMMLPQTLKKIDLKELEELCANELSGMSKCRILSILNGNPMLNSSDTNESDDSGPSLEIISDTEEWISDSEIQVKKENDSLKSNKTKKKTKIKSKDIKSQHNKVLSKEKSQQKDKNNKNDKNDSIQKTVKSEKSDKDDKKSQEGESLLDLLELEMRARAIRALIRKEEDIIPNLDNKTSNGSTNTTENNINSNNDNNKVKYKEKIVLEKKLDNDKEDEEDVVLVVKPMPTIYLLSSDEENEDRNKTKRTLDKNILTADENNVISNNETSDKTENNNDIINKDKKSPINSPSPTIKQEDDNKKHENEDEDEKEEGEVIEDEEEKEKKDQDEDENVVEKINEKGKEVIEEEKNKNSVMLKNKLEKTDELNVITQNKTDVNNLLNNEPTNDKLIDYGEVIDLDDYPDDVDDLENEINNSSPTKLNKNQIASTSTTDPTVKNTDNTQETWASRYYQTDNVQSVIKESKIQSEIRKRLRERQKLSKLSNSPKNTVELNGKVNDNVEKFKPTGSVEEYLAIKNSINSDCNLDLMKDNENNLKIDEGSSNEKVAVSTQQNTDSLQQPSTSIDVNVS